MCSHPYIYIHMYVNVFTYMHTYIHAFIHTYINFRADAHHRLRRVTSPLLSAQGGRESF